MKTGLALSGGGALGAAHVGVLEELDRCVDLEVVCGSSAGAIVGLLYVDGGTESIERFRELLERTGITKTVAMLARTPSVNFERIRTALSRIVRAKSFDKLPRSFVCVATDIVSGEMVIMDHGNPVDAAMASAAFPGLFAPQRVDDRAVVDGGVTRNLPADVVRQQGAEFVVGSSLPNNFVAAGRRKDEEQFGRVRAVLRALSIMANELAALQSRDCDFCFYPPVDAYTWRDFDRIADIIEIGRVYARERVGSLMEMVRTMETHSL